MITGILTELGDGKFSLVLLHIWKLSSALSVNCLVGELSYSQDVGLQNELE